MDFSAVSLTYREYRLSDGTHDYVIQHGTSIGEAPDAAHFLILRLTQLNLKNPFIPGRQNMATHSVTFSSNGITIRQRLPTIRLSANPSRRSYCRLPPLRLR
jgi:hypothetical protein